MASAFIANTSLSHLTEISSNATGRIIYQRCNAQSGINIIPINQTIIYPKSFHSVWMLSCLFTSTPPESMNYPLVYEARPLITLLGIPVTFSIRLSGNINNADAYKSDFGDSGFNANFTIDMTSNNSFRFTFNHIVNSTTFYGGIFTYAIMVL